MTAPSPMQYGSVKYQSPTDKALGSITQKSYAYKQEGEILAKLTGDVSFMADNQRKMQKGIDKANENVIQQFQGFINDVVVLFGGGSPDEVIDLGDLRYVFQGIGALFGLGDGNGGIQLPFNLFNAAQHFVTQFLFPAMDWKDGFDTGIDNFISVMLNVIDGLHVPFITEAAQNFAVMLSGWRDDIGQALDWIEDLFNKVWKLIQATWDCIFGGKLYAPTGPVVVAWSPEATANFQAAWNAFIQLIFPGATTPTTNKVALGTSAFNGLFSNWDFSLDVEDLEDNLDALWDSSRRAINSAVQGLHIGYFNATWQWIFGTPSAGDLFTITSGSGTAGSDNSPRPGGGSSTHLDEKYPPPPSTVSLSWQSTWPDGHYPSGDVYICVTSVKDGIEGPPSNEVKIWVAGLGESQIKVTATWPAVASADGYNIYRRVVSLFGNVSYRRLNASLITSTTYNDTTIKTGGIVDEPPTKDELDALVVGDKVGTAQTAADLANNSVQNAQNTANSANDTANAVKETLTLAYQNNPNPTIQHGYSDLYNAGKSLSALSNSGYSLASSAVDILATSNNKPMYLALDGTSDAVFPIETVGALPFTPLSPNNEIGSYFRIGQTGIKNVISWMGYGVVGMTSLIIRVYRIDKAGRFIKVYQSPNLIDLSQVDTSNNFGWNYHISSDISVVLGEVYFVSIKTAGGSGYNLVAASTAVPEHPFAVPKSMSSLLALTGLLVAVDGTYNVDTSPVKTAVGGRIRASGNSALMTIPSQANPAVIDVSNYLDTSSYSPTKIIDLGSVGLPSQAINPAKEILLGSDLSSYILQSDSHHTIVKMFPDESWEWRQLSPDNPTGNQIKLTADLVGLGMDPMGRMVTYDNSGGVSNTEPRFVAIDTNTNSLSFYWVNQLYNNVVAMCQGVDSQILYAYDGVKNAILTCDMKNNYALNLITITYGSLPSPQVKDIAVAKDGAIYLLVGSGSNNYIYEVDLTRGAVLQSSYPNPISTKVTSIACAKDNSLLLMDDTNHRITVLENPHMCDGDASSATYSQNIPYFGWGYAGGEYGNVVQPPAKYPDAVSYPDQIVELTSERARIPDWCNTIFLLANGAGGGGGGATFIDSLLRQPPPSNTLVNGRQQYYGFPGGGGEWRSDVAYRNVDFEPGMYIWADIGKGGAAGRGKLFDRGDTDGPFPGAAGGPTTIHVANSGAVVVAAGGNGGAIGTSTSNNGFQQYSDGGLSVINRFPPGYSYSFTMEGNKFFNYTAADALGGTTLYFPPKNQNGGRDPVPGGDGKAWAIFSQRIL